MNQYQIVGKIEPDELRHEIKFAKKMVDAAMDQDRNILTMWGNILNFFVKRIVPSE